MNEWVYFIYIGLSVHSSFNHPRILACMMYFCFSVNLDRELMLWKSYFPPHFSSSFSSFRFREVVDFVCHQENLANTIITDEWKVPPSSYTLLILIYE